MGAGQHEFVHALGKHRFQPAAQQRFRCRRVQFTGLYRLHQSGAWLLQYLNVLCEPFHYRCEQFPLERRPCSDHPDDLRSGPLRSRLQCRLHAHEQGVRIGGPHFMQSRCRCRIAGDHHQLTVFAQQRPHDGRTEGPHLPQGSVTVRYMHGIPEIEQALPRERLLHCCQYREPSDTGIEDADGSLCGGHVS